MTKSLNINLNKGISIQLDAEKDPAKLGQALGTTVSQNWSPKSGEEAAREIAFALAHVSSDSGIVVNIHKIFADKRPVNITIGKGCRVDAKAGLYTCIKGLFEAIGENLDSCQEELSSFLDAFIRSNISNKSNLNVQEVLDKSLDYLKRFISVRRQFENMPTWSWTDYTTVKTKKPALDEGSKSDFAVKLALASIFAEYDNKSERVITRDPFNPLSQLMHIYAKNHRSIGFSAINKTGPINTYSLDMNDSSLPKTLLKKIFTDAGGKMPEPPKEKPHGEVVYC